MGEAASCRFRDCTHAHEPGRAVRAAVKEGAFDPQRLERWRLLQNETAENDRTKPRGAGDQVNRGRGKQR